MLGISGRGKSIMSIWSLGAIIGFCEFCEFCEFCRIFGNLDDFEFCDAAFVNLAAAAGNLPFDSICWVILVGSLLIRKVKVGVLVSWKLSNYYE